VSRGTTSAVPVTRPIIDTLPSIYQDGHFLRGFVGGLDEVWASVFATLDCLHAYIDPMSSPEDFLTWLGGWVGAELDEDWATDRRRAFIGRAAAIYAGRGTAAALVEEVGLYSGASVEVDDPGSVTTSRLPGGWEDGEVGGSDRTVRIVVAGDGVSWPALQAVVRAAVPAHLPVEIELRETGGVGTRERTEGAAEGGDGR
jgi:phage tail-like protein